MSDVIVNNLDNAKIMVLSEQGETHEKNGICNQDSYSYTKDSFGNYAFVVADGVSSCVHAKEGSLTACEVICNLLTESQNLSDEKIQEIIFTDWKKSINNNWNEYGTTVNFVYIYPDRIVMGKIGDGAVICKTSNESVIIYDDTDFYTSETFALGEVLPKEAFTIKSVSNNLASNSLFLLMTDGIVKELEADNLKGFTDYIFSNFENPDFVLELNNWVNELKRKNGDDKTILICLFER